MSCVQPSLGVIVVGPRIALIDSAALWVELYHDQCVSYAFEEAAWV
jgi:hypothetical protein